MTKFEIRVNFKCLNAQRAAARHFRHSEFELHSNFEFRISSFAPVAAIANRGN